MKRRILPLLFSVVSLSSMGAHASTVLEHQELPVKMATACDVQTGVDRVLKTLKPGAFDYRVQRTTAVDVVCFFSKNRFDHLTEEQRVVVVKSLAETADQLMSLNQETLMRDGDGDRFGDLEKLNQQVLGLIEFFKRLR